MTPADVVRLLAKASAFDQRTVGESDVLAWHEILYRYELADGLAAVTRHYTEERARLMPADLVKHMRAIRDDRKRLEAKHPVRELPGRFETDEERDERNKAHIARIRTEILAPLAPLLARLSIANDELGAALAPDVWWADDEARERHAAAELGEPT